MATNPFDSIFASIPKDQLSTMTDPNLIRFRKVYGDVQPTPPSYLQRIQKAAQSDPSELLKIPTDLALMGTGDLLNKAAAGYAGLGAATGSLSSGQDFDAAIQAGMEAATNYKAPQGPARTIQERPRSKVLEEVFRPVSEGVETVAQG